MDRQPDDQAADFFLLHQLTDVASILITTAPLPGDEREGDLAVRIGNGQADADAAVIDPEQSGAGCHRYFSRPFFFSNSTSCLTAASSRRSATSVASSS